MTNPNYRTYLGTALQLQRWRDFAAHLTAFATINTILIVIWLLTGQGSFWPAASLAAWGLGLSSQHWMNALRGPITDEQVRHRVENPNTPTVRLSLELRAAPLPETTVGRYMSTPGKVDLVSGAGLLPNLVSESMTCKRVD